MAREGLAQVLNLPPGPLPTIQGRLRELAPLPAPVCRYLSTTS